VGDRIVDLTHPVTAGMRVYPGDPPVRVDPAATLAVDGVMVSELHLGTHTGTHVDAPRHVVGGAAAVDVVPLQQLYGAAWVVHVPASPGQRITLDDVAGQLTGLAGEPAIGIVLVRTDWSRHFGTDRYYRRHPYLDVAIAGHLLELGVRTVGVDTPSPDPFAGQPARLPFHVAFLGAGGVIVENLANLAAVTWRDPVFSALPLALVGLDGSPVRAVACGG
jgi:kynurenine formamidase